MTEILEAMTRPDANGTPALPKRSGPKGLLPSTWMNRTLRVAYTDCHGSGVETKGTLLTSYPAGRPPQTDEVPNPMWRDPALEKPVNEPRGGTIGPDPGSAA